LLFAVGASSIEGFSQSDSCNYSINGTVLDVETNEAIPFANIKVKGINKFTSSNIDGYFKLEGLCSDQVDLIISCVGFSDSICTHHHQHGKAPHFYLSRSVQNLDEVLIEVEKNKERGTESMAQSTIKRAEIATIPSQSLASTISNVEGVSFTSTGSNVQLPIIHGLYGNRILIVNNGLKHSFQNWSRDHAPEIDVSSANSITVIKGAAGVQFGPEALGGAIIVESNPLYLNNPLEINAGGAYQTNGKGYSGNFSIAEGFKKWSYFAAANYTKIGDRTTADYVLTNSGKEENSFNGGLRYHQEHFDVKLYYSYIDQNLAFLRSSVAESGSSFIRAINADKPVIINPFSYEINEPNQLTEHHLGKVEIDWRYSDEASLTFRAGRQINYRQEYDVRRNADKPIIDLDLITADYQVEWKHPHWHHLDGIVGVQFFKQENLNNPGTGTTAFIPNYVTERLSAFVVESKTIEKNTFELGLRIDFEDDFIAGRETSQALFIDDFSFTNITSSVGFIRNFSEKTSFRVNLGTAWRSPNMAELYSFGQHGFKTNFGLLRYYYNQNGDLRTNRVLEFNESDVQAENGYKLISELELKEENSRHVFTAYSHLIQNFIYTRPYAVIGTIRGPMPVFIFDQADAFFVGFDYSWKRKWTEAVSGKLGVSYLYSRNIEDEEALINQTPIQLQYDLSWESKKLWKFDASTFSIRPSYTFQQFQAPRTVSPESLIERTEIITNDSEIFDFMDAPDAYFLLNLSWQFKWKQIHGGITIENLFNQAYRDYLNEMRYFADEVGRNIILNISYRFNAKNTHK
tara:strand:+ start:7362 stop:9767 length:2406 start_codon:yes stop_codon:yes gene_type:complete